MVGALLLTVWSLSGRSAVPIPRRRSDELCVPAFVLRLEVSSHVFNLVFQPEDDDLEAGREVRSCWFEPLPRQHLIGRPRRQVRCQWHHVPGDRRLFPSSRDKRQPESLQAPVHSGSSGGPQQSFRSGVNYFFYSRQFGLKLEFFIDTFFVKRYFSDNEKSLFLWIDWSVYPWRIKKLKNFVMTLVLTRPKSTVSFIL